MVRFTYSLSTLFSLSPLMRLLSFLADLMGSGFYGSNVLPLADPKSVGLAKVFEAAMYAAQKEALGRNT